VDAALEERATARLARIVPPAVRRLTLHGGQVDEPDIADLAGREHAAQDARERLVRVVLGHQHAALVVACGRGHDVEVGRVQEGRLFHDHVLARAQGAQRQLQVRRRGRGHEDRMDAAVRDRRLVAAVGPGAPEAALELGGLRVAAARVEAAGRRAHAPERAAVGRRDGSAAQEGEVERRSVNGWHGVTPPSRPAAPAP
jgi:hypothetical protein